LKKVESRQVPPATAPALQIAPAASTDVEAPKVEVKVVNYGGEEDPQKRLTPEGFKELTHFARLFHELLVEIPRESIMKRMLSERGHTILVIEDGQVSHSKFELD